MYYQYRYYRPSHRVPRENVHGYLLIVSYTVVVVLTLSTKFINGLYESTFTGNPVDGRGQKLFKQHDSHQDILMENALHWVHFSVDMWTSPTKSGVRSVMVHDRNHNQNHQNADNQPQKRF